jgi:hypothetical protein
MLDRAVVGKWLDVHCEKQGVSLSSEQASAVQAAVASQFSVLTGGPGCGKTTTTLVIVRVLEYLGKRVLLAAPTGRAAQRMAEVIGREAKTLHRLLEWQGGQFKKNEEQPLRADFLIVDECSMLDISLTATLKSSAARMSGSLYWRCRPAAFGGCRQCVARYHCFRCGRLVSAHPGFPSGTGIKNYRICPSDQ